MLLPRVRSNLLRALLLFFFLVVLFRAPRPLSAAALPAPSPRLCSALTAPLASPLQIRLCRRLSFVLLLFLLDHCLLHALPDFDKEVFFGEGGSRLRAIGTEARKDMERLFDQKVMLRLWVKVRAGWSDDERALKSLGYDER